MGVLNDYDLITSKLLRGTLVDFDDCRALAEGRHGDLDLDRLAERFKETASRSAGEGRLLKNLEIFLTELLAPLKRVPKTALVVPCG